MKLIRKIGRKIYAGRLESWGEFECPFDNKIVERPLSNGKKQKSCGCVKYIENKTNFKHGDSFSRLHNVWNGMKQRVLNANRINYKDYGGRGITICQEWVNDYTKFRDWALHNGYADNLEIDRIETNGNYEPSNCQWITHKENCNNRRSRKNRINL